MVNKSTQLKQYKNYLIPCNNSNLAEKKRTKLV